MFCIEFDYGGSGQCWTGTVLYAPNSTRESDLSAQYAADFIFNIMEVFGVDSFSKIAGHVVYALSNSEREYGGRIVGVESPKFATGKRITEMEMRAKWLIQTPADLRDTTAPT